MEISTEEAEQVKARVCRSSYTLCEQLKDFSLKKPLIGFKQGKLSFVILKVYSGYCADYLRRTLPCRRFIISSASKEARRSGLLRVQLASQNITILVVVIIN